MPWIYAILADKFDLTELHFAYIMQSMFIAIVVTFIILGLLVAHYFLAIKALDNATPVRNEKVIRSMRLILITVLVVIGPIIYLLSTINKSSTKLF